MSPPSKSPKPAEPSWSYDGTSEIGTACIVSMTDSIMHNQIDPPTEDKEFDPRYVSVSTIVVSTLYDD